MRLPFRPGIKGLLTASALLCTGVSIYFHIFSGFSWWDDEGYLMATVQAFLRGHLLYDQIYTLYGPFYYLVEWAFYAGTALAVSHDCVRLIAMILWPVTAILVAWTAHRLTRSLILSGFTLLAAARLLLFFQVEPGHPEEICILLVACLLLLASGCTGPVSPRKAIVFGCLLSALALTKINIGLYAALALLLSFLVPGPRTLNKAIFAAVGAGSMAVIAVIMSPLVSLPWARNYCCFVLLSLAGALVLAWVARSDVSVGTRAWIVAGAAFAVTALLIVTPFLLRGTTLSALIHVTITQHKDFARHWFRASQFRDRSVLWAGAALLLAVRSAWTSPGNQRFSLALQVLKGVLGAFAAYKLMAAFVEPTGIGMHTAMVIAPFSWLALVPPSAVDATRQIFARTALCFFSVFLQMYAFPVWGSQWMFAAVPLAPLSAVFLNDARLAVLAWKPSLASRPVRQLVTAASLAILALYYGLEFRGAYTNYWGLIPFGLPGTSHIRVYHTDAETNQWLTREIDRRCSSFFSMPGLFSLYFWTHQQPPTMLMMNDWPAFLNAEQQETVIRDLKRNATGCIVYNPDLVEFLRAGQDLSLSPLARYIHAEFAPVEQRNGYYFMIRKRAPN